MGKVFKKAFRILGLDERKGRLVVEQDFHGNFQKAFDSSLNCKTIRFESFVFSFFVPVWNSLLNLWLFFMSFVATSSYVIVSRPCRLSESYLNPLNPKIKIWILICCPQYTFVIKAVVRSCWSINSLCLVWSCP